MSVSESSRSYILVYYLSVFVLLATVRVIYTFRTNEPYLKFSPNSPSAISTDKILHTNEMLTCTNNVDSLNKVTLIPLKPQEKMSEVNKMK